MRRGVDVYALTSAEVQALAAFLERACVAGVVPIGPTGVSARVVGAMRVEAARLDRLAQTDSDEGSVKPCGAVES